MRRNVLHLIPSFNQGGSERQAVQLIKLLAAERSYNVSVACLDRTGVLFDDVRNIGFESVPEFPLKSFYDTNMIRQVKRFAHHVKSSRIDIVQTHDFYSNIFGMLVARLAGIRVRIAAKRETGMRSAKQLFIERRAFGLANRVVVNSEKVRDYLVSSGVQAKKLEVIYNGIDVSSFDKIEGDRSLIESELGLPSDRRFVTIVANLRSEVKDHAMFLRAAAKVSKTIDDVGFVISGEGELVDEIKRTAADLGLVDRTFFIGRCSRIPELLSISDVCVLSSKSEGFSNSIIEYMAAGKPVVATDVGGAAEAIVEGETGYLVPSGNAELMAKRIISLAQDSTLTESFGRAGRRRVAQRFSTTAQLEKTLALYEKELGRKGI